MSTRFLLLVKDLLIHQTRHLYQDKWLIIIRQRKENFIRNKKTVKFSAVYIVTPFWGLKPQSKEHASFFIYRILESYF